MPKKRIVATGIESTHMVGTSKRGSGKKAGASRKGKPVSGRKTSRPAVRVTKKARAGKARRAAKKTAAKKPSRVTAAAAKKGAGGHPSARKKGAPRTLSTVKGKAQAGIAKRKSASAPKAGRAQAKTAKPIAPKAAPALPSHARKRAGPAQRAVRRTMGVVGAATAPTRPSTPATGDNEAETGKADELPAQAAEGMLGPNPFIGLRPQDIASTIQAIGQHAVMSPMLVLEHEAGLARDLIAILSGHGAIAPSPGDRRFTDTAWKDNPFYRMYLQGYLAWSTVLNRFVDKSGMDGTTRERARFVVSLLTDALAPTNTLLGNPTALKRAIDSGGSSLLEGLSHLLTDLSSNQGMPAQVDKKAFQVGENLAISPGAVVFRNDVLELIQYAPATPEIYARPQLIVPPQINKFYIFDLAPGKSLVEYLVKNAFQVFVVSWRNPTQAQRDWGIDTYVEALLEAIAALRDITGAEDVNLHGACSGAMTMAALLGYLAAKGQKLVNAATLMVAVFGLSGESALGLFATPEIIAAAKQNSLVKGVLDGQEMGRVFAWMRPNDLVWNYWVNNYLMGNPPPAFDILYWNNDTTRLAAKFHGQIIDIFADNLFQKPGAIEVLGTAIDLSRVDCDKYVVAGVTDHITPWKGVFGMARMFGGRTDFVLSSSGHIQSLINPPGNPKAKYSLNPLGPVSPEQWLTTAEAVSGSWWDYWRQWLAARSGEMRAAPVSLGNDRYRPRAKAPGTYVIEP